jgi:hypothetical protein
VLEELLQDLLEVAGSGDQEVVEAFPAQGADEAFCDGCGSSGVTAWVPVAGRDLGDGFGVGSAGFGV